MSADQPPEPQATPDQPQDEAVWTVRDGLGDEIAFRQLLEQLFGEAAPDATEATRGDAE